MDSIVWFSVLAFLFSAAAYAPYTESVLRDGTQLTISTWISWFLMDAALLAGMLSAGVIVWQMLAYLLGIIVVLTASMYKGAAVEWTRLDTGCLIIVIIAVSLWGISGDPNLSIILNLVAITVGTIPMFRNVWRDPTREPIVPWVFITIGGGFGVAAIPSWTIAAALTPVWFFVLQILTTGLILRRHFPRTAYS